MYKVTRYVSEGGSKHVCECMNEHNGEFVFKYI